MARRKPSGTHFAGISHARGGRHSPGAAFRWENGEPDTGLLLRRPSDYHMGTPAERIGLADPLATEPTDGQNGTRGYRTTAGAVPRMDPDRRCPPAHLQLHHLS